MQAAITTIDAASTPAPRRSGRPASGSLLSGTNLIVATREASATGMLTKKTVLHPQPNRSASVSTPPSTSPIAEAKPSTAP